MKTLLEKRRVERNKAVTKMRADHASPAKIEEAVRRFNDRDAQTIGREQTKVLSSLAGIFIDESLVVQEVPTIHIYTTVLYISTLLYCILPHYSTVYIHTNLELYILRCIYYIYSLL